MICIGHHNHCACPVCYRYDDEFVTIPTTSELIEACEEYKKGERGFCLADHGHEWVAILERKTGRGSTPEEAVAKLWLALNSKS